MCGKTRETGRQFGGEDREKANVRDNVFDVDMDSKSKVNHEWIFMPLDVIYV